MGHRAEQIQVQVDHVKVLALDTSSSTASVAVVSSGTVLAESVTRALGHHAEVVLPLTDEVLRRAQVPLAEIDLIAVGLGPGSFTGVRIGVATAKALSLSTGIPMVGVSSLDALAASAVGAQGTVATVLDARRDEVFLCVYQVTRSIRNVVLAPEHVAPEIAGQRARSVANGNELLAIGNLDAAQWQRFVLGANGAVSVLPTVAGSPLARFIALEAMCGRYHGNNGDQLEPIYVRPSDAKLPAVRQAKAQ